jgi:DNA-binding transcriptional regulator YiaG
MMYHYTECGLDNVWLSNGYTEKKTAYGKAVSISNADELHKILAEDLIKKPGRLTGKEFRFLRVQLGLSQSATAKAQGVSEQNVSLWERHGKVPKANDHLMRVMYMLHESKSQLLEDAFDRIMTVERLVHQRVVAKATAKGWAPTLEHLLDNDERFALAA